MNGLRHVNGKMDITAYSGEIIKIENGLIKNGDVVNGNVRNWKRIYMTWDDVINVIPK